MLAAAGAGVAGVLVVVVFGHFMTLLSDFTNGNIASDDFLDGVVQQA